MINANHATKAKQNLDVTNETIGVWLLFWFVLIHFLNAIWLLVGLEK